MNYLHVFFYGVIHLIEMLLVCLCENVWKCDTKDVNGIVHVFLCGFIRLIEMLLVCLWENVLFAFVFRGLYT